MIRFLDSFDHYTDMSQKWDGTYNLFLGIVSGGRWAGGQCASTSGPFGTQDSRRGGYKNIGGTETTIIVGFAFQLLFYSSGGNSPFLTLDEIGLGTHMQVAVDASGRLVVLRGSTTLDTYSVPIAASRWRYLEFKTTIHDSTGSYELRLDGATVLSASGVDTRNGGSGYVDRINLSGVSGNAFGYQLEDLYVLDGVDSGVAGNPNDDFWGDTRIECLFPNGNGNSSDFDGSDGNSIDNYLLVDDTAPDGDTTYVEAGVVGDKDTYACLLYTSPSPRDS